MVIVVLVICRCEVPSVKGQERVCEPSNFCTLFCYAGNYRSYRLGGGLLESSWTLGKSSKHRNTYRQDEVFNWSVRRYTDLGWWKSYEALCLLYYCFVVQNIPMLQSWRILCICDFVGIVIPDWFIRSIFVWWLKWR